MIAQSKHDAVKLIIDYPYVTSMYVRFRLRNFVIGLHHSSSKRHIKNRS